MSSWISSAPTLFVSLLVILGPGLLVSSVGGARGITRWALAAPVSFSLASLSAIVFPLLGTPYTPLTFVLSAVIAAVATLGVRLLLRRTNRTPARIWGTPLVDPDDGLPSQRRGLWLLLCVLASAYSVVALAGRLMRGIGAPESVAQLFDNVFHLNAIRLIADTQQGSSLTLGNLTEASQAFYPAAFHDITAIVMTLSGSDVAVSINATSIVLAAVIWPLALIFLGSQLFGRHPAVFVAAAVIAPALGSFPYRMFSFGVLYSFLAGLCMLPIVLGLLINLFGVARTRHLPTVAIGIAIIGTVPGVALTHPSVIVAALAFSLPFAVQRVIAAMRNPSVPLRERAIVSIIGATYLLATVLIFVLIRPPLSSAPWNPTQSYKEAMGAVLTLSPGMIAVQWGVFVLAAAGIIYCVRHPFRFWPVAALAAVGAVMYFASAALPNGLLRDLLSGVWYRDTQRLAALFAIAAAPLAILGFVSTARAIVVVLTSLRKFRSTNARELVSIVTVVVLMLGTIAATQRGPVTQAEEWVAMSFGNRGGFALLSDDERAVLAEAAEIIPDEEVVLGSPRTGASLVYAVAGRWTIAPHIFGTRTPEEQFLLDHWDEAGINPDVCPVIRELDAYWALDFGSTDVLGGEHKELKGTDALDSRENSGIEQRASRGDAALYEATACR
ncbi:DUF6541 family protein [Microbacterium tenebrionis]|uniref:DUF6541 family protein n=1 Tax=Microbacterium tenebrionis TaxID=2830665 RepID=UPI00158909E8|nr:DUF6541 family protein [Microbacterium ihumii]